MLAGLNYPEGRGAVIAPKTISTIHPPMKIETCHAKSLEGGIMNDLIKQFLNIRGTLGGAVNWGLW